MDVQATRNWAKSHRRIKDVERQLIFAALDAYEALTDATAVLRRDLEPITTAARTRSVAVWDVGGRALAELACHHLEAQEIFRDLATSKKNNERFQAISSLSKAMPKPFVRDLLGRALNDRSKSVRLRAAMICDSLRLKELLPELRSRAAIEPDAQVKHELEFHATMIRDGYQIEHKDGRLSLCIRVRNGWSWQDITQVDIDSGRVPKNPSGLGTRHDRRFAHLPGLASIVGTKDACRFGSAGCEPNVLLAMGDEAGAAGREGALAGQSGREPLGRQRVPMGAAIVGHDHLKPTLERVTEGNVVLLVPQGNGVVKGCGVGVFELHSPGFATIDGPVNTGCFPRTRAEQVGEEGQTDY